MVIAIGLLVVGAVLIYSAIQNVTVAEALQGETDPQEGFLPGVGPPGTGLGAPVEAFGGASTGTGAWGGAKGVIEEVYPVMKSFGIKDGSKKRPNNSVKDGMSDHWVACTKCYATDFPTGQGAAAARAAGRHYGFPFDPVGTFRRHTVRRPGGNFSIQILWNVTDHYDHVHIGARRV